MLKKYNNVSETIVVIVTCSNPIIALSVPTSLILFKSNSNPIANNNNATPNSESNNSGSVVFTIPNIGPNIIPPNTYPNISGCFSFNAINPSMVAITITSDKSNSILFNMIVLNYIFLLNIYSYFIVEIFLYYNC